MTPTGGYLYSVSANQGEAQVLPTLLGAVVSVLVIGFASVVIMQLASSLAECCLSILSSADTWANKYIHLRGA